MELVDEDVELVEVTLKVEEVSSIVAPELVEVKVVDESVEVDVNTPDVVLTTSVTKLDEEGGSCRARRRTSRLVW